MTNPWYKALNLQPVNTLGKRRILEVHLDNPLGALAEGLENLARALVRTGGVAVPGTVTVTGTVLSVSARVGITLDASAALASGGQTVDLSAVAEGNQIRAYLQAAPIPQDTTIVDPDTSQALTHTTYLQLGKLDYADGATLPACPSNAVPVASLTRVPGGVTLDQVENPPIRLRGFLEATGTLDFDSIPAGETAELSLALPGATPSDAVMLAPPSGLEAGLLATAYVSAADTVTIRVFNASGAALDPANAPWRVVLY